MRKTLFALLSSMLIFFLLQAGCEKRTVRTSETDWDAVKAIISQYPSVFALGFFDTESDTLFYREITQSNADIEAGTLSVADSLHFFDYITLIWGDSLKGKFHYRFNGKLYEKPITSIALTNAYFEKWGDNYDPYRGWLFKQFGGTVIHSVGATRVLSTVNVVSDGMDTTFSQTVLQRLAKKDSILVLGKGKSVTFTVEPLTDTSDFFFLHVKEGEVYQKIPFANNGDGTLSAGWTTTSDPDPTQHYFHAIVDVVSRESVTDTIAEYDSKAWGIVYQIE